MRAIGFNAGQFGDVVMGMVAARAHKEQFPESKLTLGIAEKYSAIAGLFKNNPLVDDVHIWKGYNDWPAIEDHLAMAQKGWTKVYNAMPRHTSEFWYLSTHQTAEMCSMHGLMPPSNLKVELNNYWRIRREPGRIALSLFAETRGNEKIPSFRQIIEMAELLDKLGFKMIQLGLASEPDIPKAERFIGSFEESVKTMLSCEALITVDTAMSWIASGYSMPVVGLYGWDYYSMAKTSKNWQPVNHNAIYVESPTVRDIMTHRIEKAIRTLLKK